MEGDFARVLHGGGEGFTGATQGGAFRSGQVWLYSGQTWLLRTAKLGRWPRVTNGQVWPHSTARLATGQG
ncbi:hypothetical protein SLA2020_282500 [Shorea laevis]